MSGWPAVSTPVLRSLAGKPGAAKKALLEIYGEELDTAPASSFDGESSFPAPAGAPYFIACSCKHQMLTAHAEAIICYMSRCRQVGSCSAAKCTALFGKSLAYFDSTSSNW